MAGVAQSHIYRRFAWQACHLWYWVAPLGRDLAPGRRAALCVAGVAQPDIHLRFTWQAWHKLTSTVVLRGRRATDGTGWRPWAGIWRRGAAPLCVAGVAQSDIHLRFTWQAWHNLTSTVVLRGRRATYGTGWRPWAGIWRRGAAPLCVAGVAQPDIHLRFTWQAWHKLTSTVVLRGRRATYGTGWRPWAGIWRLGFLACLRMLCAGLSVLWSRRHVVFSDLFSSSHRLFYWPVCACYVPACLMVAPACFIFRCVSCFYRHVLCVVALACLLHVYLPACFFFPRGRYDRQGPDMVAFAQLEVADNSSSTHTTATQLQLVSQGKDAVIGSSLVVLVVVAQGGKKRSVQCNSFCFGDLSPTWKEAAEADIAEDSVTTTTTTITSFVSDPFCGQHALGIAYDSMVNYKESVK